MDIYEIDQNEEFEDKQQPTLEQIKKMVDRKRQKITKARAILNSLFCLFL